MDKIHNLYVVTHGKSHYVAGLNWEVITPQSARRSRRQAKESGADHYLVWRQPDTVLLGMTVLSAFRETVTAHMTVSKVKPSFFCSSEAPEINVQSSTHTISICNYS